MKYTALLMAVLLVFTSCANNAAASKKRAETDPFGNACEKDKGSSHGIVRNAASPAAPGRDIQKLIIRFFDACYQANATLTDIDISPLFHAGDENAQKSRQINQAVVSYLIALRRLQPHDLTMKKYTYGITYLEQNKLENGDVEIILHEDSCVRFSFIPETDSYSSGIRHTFLIGKDEKNSYKIKRHQKNEDVYFLFASELEEACEAAGKELWKLLPDEYGAMTDRIRLNLLAEAKKNIMLQSLLRRQYLAGPSRHTPDLRPGNAYDREAAVAYSYQWTAVSAVVRNGKWRVYDNMGGNCNNFISQCIFAGGIPMDNVGAVGVQWKWYGDALEASQTASGRSPSWTGVGEFYQYCLYNSGFGLAAWAGGNPYAGEAGDILQFGAADEWRHSVMIVRVLTDSKGRVTDYLINSNTTDRINYPASAYSYSKIRLIKILGWNDG